MSSKLEATKNEPIFISYRFADKPIAEVIRKYLSFWGLITSIKQEQEQVPPRVYGSERTSRIS